MAITLETIARNASCAATVNLLNVGTGTAKLRIRAGATTLGDIQLPAIVFGAPNVGIATALGLPLTGIGIAVGTADNFQAFNRDGALVWSGSAGLSGTDMILDVAAIVIGQAFVVTAWSHQQPP